MENNRKRCNRSAIIYFTPEILILVESIVPAFAAVQFIMRLAVTDVPPTDKLVNAAVLQQ